MKEKITPIKQMNENLGRKTNFHEPKIILEHQKAVFALLNFNCEFVGSFSQFGSLDIANTATSCIFTSSTVAKQGKFQTS